MKLPSFLGRKKGTPIGAEGADHPASPSTTKAPSLDFKQIIEDFRTLDPKDPGLWPAAPRAVTLMGLLALLVGASWWFDWTPRMESLQQKRATEETLKTEWIDKKKQAVNLDAYRAQLAEIDASFGVLLEQLPNESEIGALLVDINKAAQTNGLAVEMFKPGGEARRDFYAEIPITVEFTGSYHDLGGFVGEIAQLPRIVTLNNVDLSVRRGDQIGMRAVAKTFRYLDETEVAAQRKAQKGGKK